jgi:hypothetical protein
MFNCGVGAISFQFCDVDVIESAENVTQKTTIIRRDDQIYFIGEYLSVLDLIKARNAFDLDAAISLREIERHGGIGVVVSRNGVRTMIPKNGVVLTPTPVLAREKKSQEVI